MLVLSFFISASQAELSEKEIDEDQDWDGNANQPEKAVFHFLPRCSAGVSWGNGAVLIQESFR
ncbi:protein of unknown function [Magnetospirillum gryphiswaldense MSR-1 v2]|uniref:Uncharacterized protein n=1 Tax=Magnetospirillum gryphiswaldense (strain DSM 6361 / JCM 21280 / NBRC 15271 / MSR-1) TaxID=431944 RepID=V6F070_MAGGM|nr:protein of unknown function [Magnetospirillum gryphiswaldense MSR-1 v2]